MARRSGSRPEGATPAVRVLHEAGVAHTLHPYDHDEHESGFGEEAVRSLAAAGVDVTADRLFKTLVADVDGRLVVAVVPVAARLDLKALAVAVGGRRAVLADPARAARSTGYVLGGISPLGQRTAVRTVVDSSATGFATVLVSAGRRGLQVELAGVDLVRLTSAVVADVAAR